MNSEMSLTKWNPMLLKNSVNKTNMLTLEIMRNSYMVKMVQRSMYSLQQKYLWNNLFHLTRQSFKLLIHLTLRKIFRHYTNLLKMKKINSKVFKKVRNLMRRL